MSFGWSSAISGMSADLARKQEFVKGGLTNLQVPAALNGDTDIFQVQFKRARRSFMLHPSAPRDVREGDFVRVEADRGEDLGVVLTRIPARDFKEPLTTAGFRGRGFTAGIQGSNLHWITRLATAEELMQVESKVADEEEALRMAQDCVQVRRLPMTIIDAEYQFDRHKLVFYYEAARRVDFRELVADLFNTYRTRIWMQQVDTAWLSDDEPGLELARKSGFLVDAHGSCRSSVATSSSISMTGSAMSIDASIHGCGGGGGGGGGGSLLPQRNAPNNKNNHAQWIPKLSSPQSRPLACSSSQWQEFQARRVVRAGKKDLSPSSSFSTMTRAGSNASLANMDSSSDMDDGGGRTLGNYVSLPSAFYVQEAELRGSHGLQLQNMGWDHAEQKCFGGSERMQMQSDRGLGLGFNSSYGTTNYTSSSNRPPSGLQQRSLSSPASAPMVSLSSTLLSPSKEPLHTELSPCAPAFSPNHSTTHSNSSNSELVSSGALGLGLGYGFNQREESEANLCSGSINSSNSSNSSNSGGGVGSEAAMSQALLRAPPGFAPLQRDRDSVLGPQAESVLESLGIDTDRSCVLAKSTEPMLKGHFGNECPTPNAESPSRWHSPSQSHGKGCSRPWWEDNASLLRRSGDN